MSIKPSAPSDPVPSLDAVRPRMAKAVQRGPAGRRAWSAVIKDALQRYYGKLEVAARAMGDMDPSQLTRDLDTGKFKNERLELCEDAAKAFIAAALVEAFGDADPKARVRRLIRDGRRILDELSEAVGS